MKRKQKLPIESDFCGKDTVGAKRREMVVRAAMYDWETSRDTILNLLAYCICRYAVKRVNHFIRINNRTIDCGEIVGSATAYLIKNMDRKSESGAGPFKSTTDHAVIWRNCWGYIRYSTLSAIRDLKRKNPSELQLPIGSKEIAKQTEQPLKNSILYEQILSCVAQLSPTQQAVIPILMGQITQAELARELGISEAAVSKRVKRTIAILREMLGDQINFDQESDEPNDD